MEKETPAYKRIVLKLSGEALRETGGARHDFAADREGNRAPGEGSLRRSESQISIVIGGGNIWRGLAASHRGMDRTTADYMGMLATVINGLALQSHSSKAASSPASRLRSKCKMWPSPSSFAGPFAISSRAASSSLSPAPAIPYFSTDTTAALRASEIGADIILKATKVDGIYDRDPKLHPDAQRFEHISFTDALTKRLQVMDSTAFSLCMDNKIPIVVFDMNQPTNMRDAVLGKKSAHWCRD